MERIHVFISGRVQHVFFRYNTKKEADRLSIKGWIKNLPDKRIEAVFEGNKESIKKILDYCSKGPLLSKVKNMEIKQEKPKNEKSFEVVY